MYLPCISVITVSYNAVKSIENTILSVINQTYSNMEYIIIDGGSTDGTVDIIKKYQDHLSYWISEPDKGIYDAMNKGIKLVKGEWINFMNTGDTFASEQVLDTVFSSFRTSDVLYGNTVYNYSDFSQLIIPLKSSSIAKKLPFCHQSSFVRSSLLKEYPFETKYKYAADYNFFFKLYQSGRKFEYIPVIIANYGLEGGATSSNYLQCFREVNDINGNKKKLLYPFSITLIYLRTFLLGIFPRKIIKWIRKYKNFYRKYKKNL